MGRKSLAQERRLHILHSVISCLSTYGLDRTTLSQVAEQAAMARGHMRHYTGNREEMIVDAARVFFFGDEAADQRDLDQLDVTFDTVHSGMSIDELLSFLFDDFAETGDENYAASAFLRAAKTMPEVRQIVQYFYRTLETSIQEVLASRYPQAERHDVNHVAFGLFALAYGNTSIAEINPIWDKNPAARASAQRLVDSLHPSISASPAT